MAACRDLRIYIFKKSSVLEVSEAFILLVISILGVLPISRHYVVIQLLTFVGVIYVSKKRYSLIGISSLIALLNTHALAWSIAIGFFIAIADDFFNKIARKGRFEFYFADFLRCFISIFVLYASTWLSLNSLFQTSRAIDGTSIDLNLKSILVAFGKYLGGNILIIPNSARWLDLSVSATVSFSLMIATILYIRYSRKALLFYCSSTFCLLAFNAAIYSGAGSRHYGVYFIIIIASIWLARLDFSAPCSSSMSMLGSHIQLNLSPYSRYFYLSFYSFISPQGFIELS